LSSNFSTLTCTLKRAPYWLAVLPTKPKTVMTHGLYPLKMGNWFSITDRCAVLYPLYLPRLLTRYYRYTDYTYLPPREALSQSGLYVMPYLASTPSNTLRTSKTLIDIIPRHSHGLPPCFGPLGSGGTDLPADQWPGRQPPAVCALLRRGQQSRRRLADHLVALLKVANNALGEPLHDPLFLIQR